MIYHFNDSYYYKRNNVGFFSSLTYNLNIKCYACAGTET